MRLRLLLGAAVTVLAVSPLAPAQAASSGINDFSCQPSAAHPEPVVLLHGLGANGDANWSFHGPQIAGAGYCVFSLTYGLQYPGSGGWVPIAESAQEIGAFIDQVLAATGAAKVSLVGHSEGAFQSLYVPKVAGYAPKVARVVALAPPTHGTTAGGLVTLGQTLGGQQLVNLFTDGASCRACTDLIDGGPAVAALTDGPIAQPGVKYTIVSSRYDAVVTPVSTGFVNEPGVNNYYIQDKCPFDPVGHVGIAVDSGLTSMILNGLDPTRRITCAFGLPF
ncbi:MAG TPA: alpha/beta fold hydrolase [Nocardioidaceae bacterium]|nr:alpha/beta fold hydrolase [Nocardioidaceae bacterium]